MLYLIAILFPPGVFFYAGRNGEGALCFLLCCTICGIPFAEGWAIWAAGQCLEDERTKQITDAIRESNSEKKTKKKLRDSQS